MNEMNDLDDHDLASIDGGLTVWCPLFPLELTVIGDDGEYVPVPLPTFPIDPCGGGLPWEVKF